MIGGMVDPGEDYAEAAVREAREETSLAVVGRRAVGLEARAHHAAGAARKVLHRERFFLARTASTAVDTSGLDEREKSWTLDHRWWTADEIAASTERFEPRRSRRTPEGAAARRPAPEPVAIR